MNDSHKKMYWQFAGSIMLSFFMILGYIAKFYEGTLLKIDLPLLNNLRKLESESLTSFFIWITKFGNSLTIAFITLIAVLFLWQNKKKIEAYWLVINVALISGVGNYVIKFLFARQRPSIEHLVGAHHYSFPSGHAMVAILCYGTFIFLLAPYFKQTKWTLVAQVFLGIFILLIGISRVYLGVHYPTDILAGYLIGSSWLCLSYPIFAKYRFIQVFKGSK